MSLIGGKTFVLSVSLSQFNTREAKVIMMMTGDDGFTELRI